MLNRVVLIGRLTDDPALRYTPNGVPVANFALAVERPFRSQSGEREVDFIDVVVWRRQAEHCANHLNKGRLVGVAGRIQQNRWTDEHGNKRSKLEVIADEVQFLDWPKDQQPGQDYGGGSYEDDLPF